MQKNLEDLKHFFETTLRPDLEELEKEREAVALRVQSAAMAVIGVGVLFELLFLVMKVRDPRVYFFTLLGAGAIVVGVYWFMIKGYCSIFKDCVIARLVEFLDPSLKYDKSQKVSQGLYQGSEVFKSRIEDYGGDDFVSGRIGETDFQFSELHTAYYVQTKNGRRRVSVFDGLFFVADFNKEFRSKTFVFPDNMEKTFGGLAHFFQSKNSSREQLIKMDDPDFEKEFVVYGNDQIEARYVLSTSLMKRILDFKRKTGKQIRLSFINSRVFVAIHYSKHLFEPKIFHTLFDFEPIAEYFTDLQFAIGLIEDLNLNTRIWSKK